MAKATEPRTGIVAASESFAAEADGVAYSVRKGDLFVDAHPLVRKHPTLFGPVRLAHERIETASAAPGEKRG